MIEATLEHLLNCVALGYDDLLKRPDVVLELRFEVTGEYFRTDLIPLNCDQMRRTTAEVLPTSPNFPTAPTGRVSVLNARFNVYQTSIDDESRLVELNFKPQPTTSDA
ncbi:hypothetical protein AVEN_193430-1 [Araneus ventricosus]|uniref:Uncharacterized protein n=1 Tax=Araneus ventricosus TaxID=182803 RepID=A0A4Y2G4F7_ARAVE|nr:hypothetical protein AVEN_193430-1 [Araneus ventricosus]